MKSTILFAMTLLMPALVFSDSNEASRMSNEFARQANELLKQESFDEAIAELNRSLREDSHNVRAYRLRANAYFAKGDYDRAIEDFTHIISIVPQNGKAYLDRGIVYLASGDRQQAADDIQKGLLEDESLLNELKSRPKLTRAIRELLEEQQIAKSHVGFKKGSISSKNGAIGLKAKKN